MEPLPVATTTPPLPRGDALTNAGVEELFEAAGALRHGHFLLKSGRHSDRYLEKFAVLQYPVLAVETARQLEEALGRTVRGVFAEPMERGARALRRGWPVSAADHVVLVDDILTTGASLAETVRAVHAAGATPVVASVIVDRSTGPVEVGCPIQSLGRIEI